MLQLHVWISFYLNKSQKFFPLRTLRLISRNNVCSETLSNRTKEKEITNSPLRVVDADIFSTNDSADRIYANIHAWVSAVCNARGSPEICLSHPRYTLDVTSPRTIRKNMNRRESYEGEGISNSPTVIIRARICIRHDIPVLRQPLRPSASLIIFSLKCVRSLLEKRLRHAYATFARTYLCA